jgi:hypothetical protein
VRRADDYREVQIWIFQPQMGFGAIVGGQRDITVPAWWQMDRPQWQILSIETIAVHIRLCYIDRRSCYNSVRQDQTRYAWERTQDGVDLAYC